MELAEDAKLKSIAFPGISTGVYGYPEDEAAEIAVRTVAEFLRGNDTIEKVIFCTFSARATDIIKKEFQELDDDL